MKSRLVCSVLPFVGDCVNLHILCDAHHLYYVSDLAFCFPSLQPERFVNLGIEPPKGVLLFGPPGTGKTLCARAVANRTDACFIRVIGSELVQKYVGEVRVNTWWNLQISSCGDQIL